MKNKLSYDLGVTKTSWRSLQRRNRKWCARVKLVVPRHTVRGKKLRLAARWAGRDRFGVAKAMGRVKA